MLAGGVETKFAARALAVLVAGVLVAGIARAAGLSGSTGTRPAASPGPEPDRFLPVRPDKSLSIYPDKFLSIYMDPSGRVVRRDQGGDTVSEGQAYGMLIAAATGDRGDFGAIWSWTQRHLQRPDALLAWHWDNGRVLDQMPASDADMDAAWALAIAAGRFGSAVLAQDADRIAASVLTEETEVTPIGRVLVAGPWAMPSRIVEPGYLAPEALTVLYQLTGDPRWSQLESTSGQLLLRAMSGHRLPADWVSVGTTGAVEPIAPPSRAGSAPSYGLAAARVAAWWAASCVKSERDLASSEWPLLAPAARSGAFGVSLSLSGRPQTSAVNATMAVGDGLAAAAAGDRTEADSVLASASQLDRRYPTYYGDAWVALARLLTTTDRLGGCAFLKE